MFCEQVNVIPRLNLKIQKIGKLPEIYTGGGHSLKEHKGGGRNTMTKRNETQVDKSP